MDNDSSHLLSQNLVEQKQADIYEFEANLVFRTSSKTLYIYKKKTCFFWGGTIINTVYSQCGLTFTTL